MIGALALLVFTAPEGTPVGIMTELARFEAERILDHMVREEIAAGRLETDLVLHKAG